MGVQDRDWYHKDREEKERRAHARQERDPRTTEYHPKQFRRSRQVHAERDTASAKNSRAKMHWLHKLIWWACGIVWALAIYVWLTKTK